MLEVQTWRAGEDGIGKIAVGEGQLCLQPGMFHLRGFYIHIMTPEDLDVLAPEAEAHHLHYSAGHWTPRYECDVAVV